PPPASRGVANFARVSRSTERGRNGRTCTTRLVIERHRPPAILEDRNKEGPPGRAALCRVSCFDRVSRRLLHPHGPERPQRAGVAAAFHDFAELVERLVLDLADALAGQADALADLLERERVLAL